MESTTVAQEIRVSQRFLLVVLIALLIAAVLLDLTGVAPGAGVQAIPVLVLLGAGLLIWRAVWPRRAAEAAANLNIPAEGETRVRLDLRFRSGDLALAADVPSGVLVSGTLAGAFTRQVRRSDGAVAVRLGQPFALAAPARADWRIALSPAVTWEQVRLALGASDARLDFSALPLESLAIDAVSTALEATLPRAGEVSLHVAGGRCVLRVPPGVDAEIVSDIRLGEVRVDEARFRVVEAGRRWVLGEGSPALRIRLAGGMGRVEVLLV